MAFYECELCDADGKSVATQVTVSIEMKYGDPSRGWYGTITTTRRTSLDPGKQYLIRLADGRQGKFMVQRNTSAGGDQDRAIAISGVEPLAVQK